MLKLRVFLLCFLLAFSASAQIGGKHTYQFLNLVSSPKQAALGGKNITGVTYDPTSGLYNPATINREMVNQLSLNYVNYMADVNYGSAAYAFLLSRYTGAMQVGVTYVDYGTFQGYDEFGNATGTFGGNEVALSVGYAYKIPFSKFHIGANVKLISSKLESYSSFGGALDLGITYLNEDQDLIISAVIRNLGTQFTPYHEIYESLPFEVDLGISQQIKDLPIRWHLTLQNLQQWKLTFHNPVRDEVDLNGEVTTNEPGFINNLLRHAILGVEFFPEGGFTARLGFNFRRSEELRIIDQRAFAGLSGGFSIKFNKIRLSYTYAQYSTAASSSFFGLNIDLSGDR